MEADRELLGQYVKDGSEAAFAELVRRYVRLVYSVALRQAGREAHLAEDITQNVFIILARKAHRLTGHETLVGWLHTTTRQVALCALRDQRRRQAREQEAFAMETNSSPPVPWEQLRPLLDEAVGQLNKQDRQAVLLRYFQGWGHGEVGAALGLKEDAARVRVDRAVEKLRRYFAGRGIVTTGALLGETILANAVEAEPAGLAIRVNKNAALAKTGAAVGWGGLMLRIIFMTTKNKILIAAALILLASLFTLVVPRWTGLSLPEKQAASDSAKSLALVPKNNQQQVQLPQAEPVPASSSNTVAPVTSLLADAPSQPLPGVAPPPPPPPSGRGRGTGGDNYRNLYANFFAKMKFTQVQQDAFLKVLSNNQKQLDAAFQTAKSKLSDTQFKELAHNALTQILNDPNSRDSLMIGAAYLNKTYDLLGITAQIQAIKDNTDTQLRQVLGSDANYEYYQDYSSQEGVRQWVSNAYGNALQSTGLPELSVDQQESLVGIVAKNLEQDFVPVLSQNHLQQIVDQASAILSPEQVEVLTTNLQIPGGLSYARYHQTPGE